MWQYLPWTCTKVHVSLCVCVCVCVCVCTRALTCTCAYVCLVHVLKNRNMKFDLGHLKILHLFIFLFYNIKHNLWLQVFVFDAASPSWSDSHWKWKEKVTGKILPYILQHFTVSTKTSAPIRIVQQPTKKPWEQWPLLLFFPSPLPWCKRWLH